MNIVVAPSGNQHLDRIVKEIGKVNGELKLLPWKTGEKAPAEHVDALLALGAVTRRDMEALAGLQFIQTLSDGYETVDIDAATELGIWVSYAPAQATGNGDSVAEFAILLLLAATRRLGHALRTTGNPADRDALPMASLLGKTICIVGIGSIGTKLAERLVGFGVRLIGVDRNPLLAPKQIPTRPLSEIKNALAEADCIVLTLRATAQNKNMFNADLFNAMKHSAVLVNVARGSLIDENALYDAIKQHRIAGAGLDVVADEPLKPDNRLLSLPEIFVTPHIAGLTDLTDNNTAAYVNYVLQSIAAGKHVDSILNKPTSHRLNLK